MQAVVQKKKSAKAQSCKMNGFLVPQWTVNANSSKFMNPIWDQADGPSPKSRRHQFHREQLFTGQWAQMKRWRERDSYPQLTLFCWLLHFQCHCVRQSVFPAYPGALSCKASSQRVNFWDLFSLFAFAFLRLSDKEACPLWSVRASCRGCCVIARRLLGVLGSLHTPSALGCRDTKRENNIVAQEEPGLSCFSLSLHHCFVISR